MITETIKNKMSIHRTWPELHDAMTAAERQWALDHPVEFTALVEKKYSRKVSNVEAK